MTSRTRAAPTLRGGALAAYLCIVLTVARGVLVSSLGPGEHGHIPQIMDLVILVPEGLVFMGLALLAVRLRYLRLWRAVVTVFGCSVFSELPTVAVLLGVEDVTVIPLVQCAGVILTVGFALVWRPWGGGQGRRRVVGLLIIVVLLAVIIELALADDSMFLAILFGGLLMSAVLLVATISLGVALLGAAPRYGRPATIAGVVTLAQIVVGFVLIAFLYTRGAWDDAGGIDQSALAMWVTHLMQVGWWIAVAVLLRSPDREPQSVADVFA